MTLGRKLALQLPLAPQLAAITPKRWIVAAALRQIFADPTRVDPVMRRRYIDDWRKPHHLDTLTRLSCDYFSSAFDAMTRSYDRITADTTIVWGRQDRWLPYWMGERLAEQIAGAALEEIDDCRHVPHQERPDLVNPLLVSALTS